MDFLIRFVWFVFGGMFGIILSALMAASTERHEDEHGGNKRGNGDD